MADVKVPERIFETIAAAMLGEPVGDADLQAAQIWLRDKRERRLRRDLYTRFTDKTMPREVRAFALDAYQDSRGVPSSYRYTLDMDDGPADDV